MIIYSGRGALAFYLPFLTLTAGYFIFSSYWLVPATLLLTAAELFLLIRYPETKKGDPFRDSETGEVVRIKEKNTLYFIDIKYWALFYLVFGLVLTWAVIHM